MRWEKTKDWVVISYDGFSLYLIIVDKAPHFVWVFLTNSKSPPLDIIKEFLIQHGRDDGGSIRTNQLLRDFHYTLEPIGADSSSQNSAVEVYNDKFAVRTRTLFYGSGFPAKFWPQGSPLAIKTQGCLAHQSGRQPCLNIADAQDVFAKAIASGFTSVTLLFSHPEIHQDISHDSFLIVSSAPFSLHIYDQMNKHWDFTTVANYL
jgi:hypothetical protein